jgi:uncharacterized protein YggE
MWMRIALIGLAAFIAAASAQTTTVPLRTITAVGSSTISATPDEAMVDVGVSTQAATAQDASTQNATQVSSVLAAMQNVLGPNANIKTINYSLNPVYSPGSNAAIIGYSASNTVEATLTDLTLIGKIIDVSIAAGANNVSGISFGLQNPAPVQAQALQQAATAAVAQAKAIASGLGVQTGNVLHASQGVATTYTPTTLAPTAATASSTPVEPGLILVVGTVTVEVLMQ